MPYPYSYLLFWTLPTFTLLLGAGVLLIILVAIYCERERTPAGIIVDVAVGGLIGAVILARLFHVLLEWPYFSVHQNEILRLTAGGLNWHGAVIGAVTGVVITAKWKKVHLAPLLDVMALALPVLMFAVWWGCGAAACGYGAEIQNLSSYPSWLVWEERDIYGLIYPRYATQPLGMMIAAGLLLIALALIRRGWLKGRRFGLLLILVSMSMFALGFLRGDAPDQRLDLMMVLIGLLFTGWNFYDRTDDLRLSESPAQRRS
jgi:prolipoprotein diacylglyceryltransferase